MTSASAPSAFSSSAASSPRAAASCVFRNRDLMSVSNASSRANHFSGPASRQNETISVGITTLMLLLAAGRTGEAPGFFGGSEQCLCLVDAFLLFELRIGVSHDAGAGLHIHDAVFDERGAQHDAGIHVCAGREIA